MVERKTQVISEFRQGNDVLHGLEALVMQEFWGSRGIRNAGPICKRIFGQPSSEKLRKLNDVISAINFGFLLKRNQMIVSEKAEYRLARRYKIEKITDEQKIRLFETAIEKFQEFEGYKVNRNLTLDGDIGRVAQILDRATQKNPVTRHQVRRAVFPFSRDISIEFSLSSLISKAKKTLEENERIFLSPRQGVYIVEKKKRKRIIPTKPEEKSQRQEVHIKKLTPSKKGIIALQSIYLTEKGILKIKESSKKVIDSYANLWAENNLQRLSFLLDDFEQNKDIVGLNINIEGELENGEAVFVKVYKEITNNCNLWNKETIITEKFIEQWLTLKQEKSNKVVSSTSVPNNKTEKNKKQQDDRQIEKLQKLTAVLKEYVDEVKSKKVNEPITGRVIFGLFPRTANALQEEQSDIKRLQRKEYVFPLPGKDHHPKYSPIDIVFTLYWHDHQDDVPMNKRDVKKVKLIIKKLWDKETISSN